ncbi:MAG: D-alanyl-D-alanine carboxypeptidase [Faecalibacterium sp.]|jgi:D-alanyl-D-alanine carboxypeptidase (penicillin-binding protein 5/6)|nr:D-alanyl-D-alanine carboxypeptidase [Faecalibacterium sp.]
MKKVLALILSAALLVAALAVPAAAVGYDPSATYNVQAEGAYVVNTDTNVIIYEKNSEQQVYAGGLTKLMTVALILTNYQDALDSTQITMPSAISDYVYGTTSADIRAGETVSLRAMLYGMLLCNGNDAAQGTAYVLSGNDLSGWTQQMNALSQKIGTTGSTWTDASGIDKGNITTAKDMYLILRYLMGFDAFVKVSGSYQYEMPANTKHANSYYITSTNKMLSAANGGQYYRSAVQGGKTDVSGIVESKGVVTQSCVSWATQDGSSYIFSILNSPMACDDYGYDTLRPALYETGKLLDWAFSNFAIQPALDTTQPICEIPVKYSSVSDTLMLYPADDLKTILPSGSDNTVTQKEYSLPECVYAPVEEGDVIGTVTLKLAGSTIGTVDLKAGKSIARNPILYSVAKLQAFFSSLFFRIVLILSLLCIGIYLVWFLRHAYLFKKSNKIRRH